ncbi:MAG: prolipoprotein diacylglyceryl transferase [Bacteroidales bacterium]|nr:prolipoprotein diacylglyceryl transferase [Bacteroidales bacterium]
MLLQFIEWSVSPEVFPDTWFPVRWYGLLFAAGFFFGYLILTRVFKHEIKDPQQAVKLLDKLAMYMVISTVVGARLGHVLFYEPQYYFSHPGEIIQIWNGGLASHGAAIGILFALWLFSKQTGKTYFWVLDRIVIVVALAGMFIRLGNLMNSEIYGRPSDLPWAFVFVSEDNIPRHPTQIYEALSYLGIFLLLHWIYWKNNGKPKPGFIFGLFLVLLFSARFFIEFLKEPQVNFEATMVLNMGQWLSIPFVIIGFAIIFMKGKSEQTSKYKK